MMDRIGPVFRYSFLLLRDLPPTPSCTRARLLTKKLVLVFTMAAPVIVVNNYTTFNARLTQTIGAEGDTEVASMLGRKLANSGAWEADKFPNSGTIAPAEVGAAMVHLDQLGDKTGQNNLRSLSKRFENAHSDRWRRDSKETSQIQQLDHTLGRCAGSRPGTVRKDSRRSTTGTTRGSGLGKRVISRKVRG